MLIQLVSLCLDRAFRSTEQLRDICKNTCISPSLSGAAGGRFQQRGKKEMQYVKAKWLENILKAEQKGMLMSRWGKTTCNLLRQVKILYMKKKKTPHTHTRFLCFFPLYSDSLSQDLKCASTTGLHPDSSTPRVRFARSTPLPLLTDLSCLETQLERQAAVNEQVVDQSPRPLHCCVFNCTKLRRHTSCC